MSISPRSPRLGLLPQEQELIKLIGLTPAEYRQFRAEARKYSRIRPGEPVAFDLVFFGVNLIVGLALSYAASLLQPRQQQRKPAQLETKTVDGQDIVNGARFAPQAGFDSVQNVVEQLSPIPVIFAHRETIDEGGGVFRTYGGIRVNTNLLWSQLMSTGGGQLLRSVHMISEGTISIDPYQTAAGGQLFSTYQLNPTNNEAGRLSMYFSGDGGRIVAADHVAGRISSEDPGNSENSGGPDVFSLKRVASDQWTQDSCYTFKPANQVVFGLYAPIGNNMGYRINPRIRTKWNPQLVPKGTSGDSKIQCVLDVQVAASRDKEDILFSTRSGLYEKNGSGTGQDRENVGLVAGDIVTYILDDTSDVNTELRVNNPNDGGEDGVEECGDVASTIASKQRAWDDSLIVGEQYLIGTAVGICVERLPSNARFSSEADNNPPGPGQAIEAKFQITEPGIATITSLANNIRKDGQVEESGSHFNATDVAQIFRLALGSFVVDRPTQRLEIGYKSTLGIQYSGMCNYRDAFTRHDTDDRACLDSEDRTVKSGDTYSTTNYVSGNISGVTETRYSFFRLGYRIAGTDEPFTYTSQLWGFASNTQQATYNFLRAEFPDVARWEITHKPVSGWAIRHNVETGALVLLDAKQGGPYKRIGSGSVVFEYAGQIVDRSTNTFKMPLTISRREEDGDLDILNKDGTSYVDAWGRLAEAFWQDEISASTGSPEHEISYVNLFTSNETVPTYADIATLGLNLTSSPEFSRLDQISVYVNNGFASTHLFGTCLYHIQTNERFGLGDIISPSQVDLASYQAADTWTEGRRYFFDIGISDVVNARSQAWEWANLFLLDLVTVGGKYSLQIPAEFGKIYSPVALFTSGNVLPGSINGDYRDTLERQRIIAEVKWREERPDSATNNRGLFPVVRTLRIREAGTPDTAPIVPIDMSAFCTSEIHAADVGRMECRKARLIDQELTLKTYPDTVGVAPGAVVKVGLEVLAYESPNNGVILSDGTVVNLQGPFVDGTYPVIIWAGGASAVQEVTLTVENGKATDYFDSVFCIADAVQQTQVFRIGKVDFDDEGNVDLGLTVFPLDEFGESLLTKGWDVAEDWIIEGAVGDVIPDPIPDSFDSVEVVGPVTIAQDGNGFYTAAINGTPGAYTYAWASSSGTVDDPTAAGTVITFPNRGTDTITCTVTQTSTGTVRVGTLNVDVSAKTLSFVTISGDDLIAFDTPTPYTATPFNGIGPFTYEWTTTAGGFVDPTANPASLLIPSSSGLEEADVIGLVVRVTDTGDGAIRQATYQVGLLNDPAFVRIIGPSNAAQDAPTQYQAEVAPDDPGWTFQWEDVTAY